MSIFFQNRSINAFVESGMKTSSKISIGTNFHHEGIGNPT